MVGKIQWRAFGFSVLLAGFFFFTFQATAYAKTSVNLKEVSPESFSTLSPAYLPSVEPAFIEQNFKLEQAYNYKEVLARVGGLTEEQKNFLEKNRFLLLPKKFIFPLGGSYHSVGYDRLDEMLENFDSIGGNPQAFGRLPETSVFVGPDPFLHALHVYYVNRLKYLEETHFSHALLSIVSDLYNNAARLRSEAVENAGSWERFQAQMLVPLIILKNCQYPGGSLDDKGIFDPETIGAAKNFDGKFVPEGQPDTIAKALEIFETYKASFSRETAEAITVELKQIYAADPKGSNQLGFVSGQAADYTQFLPRGHYAGNSVTRAYFRAMIWLGQLGWDLRDEKSCAEAVNFAIAMSLDNPLSSASRPDTDNGTLPVQKPFSGITEAYKSLMEITSFFAGLPDEATYPEWQAFIRSQTGLDTFTAESSGDKELIAKLINNLPLLKNQNPEFANLRGNSTQSILRVLPQRFTVPSAIAANLSYADTPGQKNLPEVFSALWVPAVFGSKFALSLLPKQIELCFSPLPNADLEGNPHLEPAELLAANEAHELKIRARNGKTEMFERINDLQLQLQKQTDDSWFLSLGSAWLKLLGKLTAEYGQAYPLYMQSRAFQSKQLESFLGSFTELKHDNLLYEKPNYAEAGEGGDDENPPVPKGFVEPNLQFWFELLRFVDHMQNGFAKYGLFPAEAEEFGTLSLFRKKVEFCARIAEKELRGLPLSDDEHEYLRTGIHLQFMAYPVRRGIVLDKTLEEILSGLIVDIQTSRTDPNGPWERILYEATADPYIMLVLIGNENTPRLTIGMAYNHREFMTTYGKRLTDEVWRKKIYGPDFPQYPDYQEQKGVRSDLDLQKIESQIAKRPPLPPKNFWYDSLNPAEFRPD